ncbi:HEAT repeat domain-containing protein [Archangium sp.]|uniref:HEAT repeat domain-containing protein n=1 Tax=Archangium sp. TaxID=1872627 RepID=UPI00286B8D4A|nr:HEAT repeat domain-containing protein [Archangium sp.]
MEPLKDELVEACAWGEEARARALVFRLCEQPRKARALLESMMQAPDARVRQAAVFGLGELGGAAIATRLEQQLVLEEARGNHDGASVAEAITLALGRLKDAGARASLVRRLERLVASKADPVDVNMVACSLWRMRHPELLPVVQRSLELLTPPAPGCLRGLRVLLEKSPEELRAWAREPSVPIEDKTGVLAVLEEELPGALIPTLPTFISAAHALLKTVDSQRDGRDPLAYHCECLASLLVRHRAVVLPALPQETRAELRELVRRLIVITAPNSSLRAAVLLQFVGRSEDAAFLEAHRPMEPILATVFDEAVKMLRAPQRG